MGWGLSMRGSGGWGGEGGGCWRSVSFLVLMMGLRGFGGFLSAFEHMDA